MLEYFIPLVRGTKESANPNQKAYLYSAFGISVEVPVYLEACGLHCFRRATFNHTRFIMTKRGSMRHQEITVVDRRASFHVYSYHISRSQIS